MGLDKRGCFTKVSNGENIMKKTLLLLSFCLAVLFAFNLPRISYGAESTSASAINKPAKTGEKWSNWVSLDSYKIGSGDILEIMTWKEPEFSREEVLVRIDGKISFPLLATSMSPAEHPCRSKKILKQG